MVCFRINAVPWLLLLVLLGAPQGLRAQMLPNPADAPSVPPAIQERMDKLNADIEKLRGRKRESEKGRSNCAQGDGACRDRYEREISKTNGELYLKHKARIDARDDRTDKQKRDGRIKLIKKQIKAIEEAKCQTAECRKRDEKTIAKLKGELVEIRRQEVQERRNQDRELPDAKADYDCSKKPSGGMALVLHKVKCPGT